MKKSRRKLCIPKYNTGSDQYYTTYKDGARFNINPNVVDANDLIVTTPEIEVTAAKPAWMTIPRNDYLREGGAQSSDVDRFVDKWLSSKNPIMSGIARATQDWRTDKSPIRAAMRNFGWWNPLVSLTSAGLDHRLGTKSNAPQLMIPQMIQDYGNRYSAALQSLYNLTSDNGLKKTKRYFDELYQSNPFEGDYAGKFWNTVGSGIGDVFDATLLKHGASTALKPLGALAEDAKIRLKNSDAIKQFNEDYIGGAYRRYKDVKNGNTPYRVMYGQEGVQNPVMESTSPMTVTNTPIAESARPIAATSTPALEAVNPRLLEGPNYRQLAPPKQTVDHTVELPSSGQTITPPLSFRQLVDEKGNINTKEAIRALRQLKHGNRTGANFIDLALNKYGHKHKRERLDRLEVEIPTLRHLQRTAEFAQKAPLPEGLTRQQYVLAALTHDIGELQSREGHAGISANIVKSMYPDTPKSTLDLIEDHMTHNNPIKSDAARALHMADVANFQTFKEAERQFPYLRYNYPGRPTLIGSTKDLDTKAQLERLNPVMEMYGYKPISDKLSDSEVREEVLRRLQHINTFGRGVRIPAKGDRDVHTGRSLLDIATEQTEAQLGRTPTEDEIATDMVSRIGVPETVNGTSGRKSFFRAIDANTKDFNTLYTSNSAETSSGYGGVGNIQYKSYPKVMKRPIKDNPEYNLIDLWLANDFPLYDETGGPLHKEYDRVMPAYLSGALKPSDVKQPSLEEMFGRLYAKSMRQYDMYPPFNNTKNRVLEAIRKKWPDFNFPTYKDGSIFGSRVIDSIGTSMDKIENAANQVSFENLPHDDGNNDVRRLISELTRQLTTIYDAAYGIGRVYPYLNRFYKNIPALSLYKKMIYDNNIVIPEHYNGQWNVPDKYSSAFPKEGNVPNGDVEAFYTPYQLPEYDFSNAAKLMNTIERRLKSKRTPENERKLLQEFYDQIPDAAKTDASFAQYLSYDLSKFLRDRIKDDDIKSTFEDIANGINWSNVYQKRLKQFKRSVAIDSKKRAAREAGDLSHLADDVDTYEMNQLQETMSQPYIFTTEMLRHGKSRPDDPHQHFVFVGPRGTRIFPIEGVTDDVKINTGRTSAHKHSAAPYLSPKLRNLIIPTIAGGYAVKEHKAKRK